ncbi:outer membrane beta-barrel protein [Mucilaginibacter sp. S1162]|uniref:Outer membrane beta-barrel protein n=1 Tax=Mucilaginibacter humi TaxID=2732510 RepID=A0ABX1W3S7_9SPHI|nr:outer membrane beta-barrel protein [Mucilaginibacter humi]
MGMDYYVSPKTTIGFVLTGNISSGKNYNPVNSNLRDAAGKIDSIITSDNNTNTKNYSGGINLNYSHQFDSLGKVLTFDLDYLKYDNHRDQTFFNKTYNAAGVLGAIQDITDNLPSDIAIYAAKTDYVQPLPGKASYLQG